MAELKRHELDEEAFRWYLDLRRYGAVPHAGCLRPGIRDPNMRSCRSAS